MPTHPAPRGATRCRAAPQANQVYPVSAVGSPPEDRHQPLAAVVRRLAIEIAIARRTGVGLRVVRESPWAPPPVLATAFVLYSIVRDRGCHTPALPGELRRKRHNPDFNEIFTFSRESSPRP